MGAKQGSDVRLADLKAFVLVAELQSQTEAGRVLGVNQSAIHRRLACFIQESVSDVLAGVA